MKGSWSIENLDSIKIHWFLRWKIIKHNAKDKHEIWWCKNWSMQNETSILGSCMENHKTQCKKVRNSFAPEALKPGTPKPCQCTWSHLCWMGRRRCSASHWLSESTCRHYHLTSKTSSTLKFISLQEWAVIKMKFMFECSCLSNWYFHGH